MRSLYLRIWLTVLVALALFALTSGWLFQRHVQAERERFANLAQGRAEAWALLFQRSLPPADAPREAQAAALRDWSMRLRLPMALDDAQGQRIGVSDSFQRRDEEGGQPPRRGAAAVQMADGRTLWIARPPPLHRPPPAGAALESRRLPPETRSVLGVRLPPGIPSGAGVALLVVLLFVAVGAGAYPVVRRLTRRLEALKQGVEAFGAGALSHRVSAEGGDEVAAVAHSFNKAAARVEALVRSHQSLLANASHELRSPLARLKMAVSMLDGAEPAQAEQLRAEIHTNVAELDALVEEVLLSSRLDATADGIGRETVELLGVAAEEAARVGAALEGGSLVVAGDERLLRRAMRNLLENARRYGGPDVAVRLVRNAGAAEVWVCDRGPGVPEAYRERIFEPFFRLPGHAEREGGVGLGLALVRQIAQRHGGSIRCEGRDGGGSCFALTVPLRA